MQAVADRPTVAGTEADAGGNTGGYRIDLNDVLFRDAETFPDITVRVAVGLVVEAQAYQHFGRGPHVWDDVGLVRAIVQGGLDVQAYNAMQPRPAEIEDFTGYSEEQQRNDPSRFAKLVEAWGYRRIGERGLHVTKAAQPGDIIVHMGKGPALSVAIAPWQQGGIGGYTPPALAQAWSTARPRIARASTMNLADIALYRMPAPSAEVTDV